MCLDNLFPFLDKVLSCLAELVELVLATQREKNWCQCTGVRESPHTGPHIYELTISPVFNCVTPFNCVTQVVSGLLRCCQLMPRSPDLVAVPLLGGPPFNNFFQFIWTL